jgi:hypothetical protein
MTCGPLGSRRRSRAISLAPHPGLFRPLGEDALPAGRNQHQDDLGRVQRLFYLLRKDVARVDAALVIEERLGIEPLLQPVPQPPGMALGIGTAVGEEDGRYRQTILFFPEGLRGNAPPLLEYLEPPRAPTALLRSTSTSHNDLNNRYPCLRSIHSRRRGGLNAAMITEASIDP